MVMPDPNKIATGYPLNPTDLLGLVSHSIHYNRINLDPYNIATGAESYFNATVRRLTYVP